MVKAIQSASKSHPVLLLGTDGHGLHEQDNNKPTRLLSLSLRLTLTMSFIQATVRLCALKRLAHYHIQCIACIVVTIHSCKHKSRGLPLLQYSFGLGPYAVSSSCPLTPNYTPASVCTWRHFNDILIDSVGNEASIKATNKEMIQISQFHHFHFTFSVLF